MNPEIPQHYSENETPKKILIDSETKRQILSSKGDPLTKEYMVGIKTGGGVEMAVPKILEEYSMYQHEESDAGLTVITRGPVIPASQKEITTIKTKQETSPFLEYFDFSPELVKKIVDTHKLKLVNLFSGYDEQFVIYIGALLNEIGFDKNNSARKFLEQCINGSVDMSVLASGIEHPIPGIKEKQLNTKEKAILMLKEYSKNVPTYERLSLLLMPNLWQDMNRKQKLQLLEGLRMVLEFTKNEDDIRGGELYMRVAEIAKLDTTSFAGGV